VRANDLVLVALIVPAGCAGGHTAQSTSPSPQPTLAALHSCEIREFSLDGADLVVQANADGTPASIVVVRAPDDEARIKAFQDARKAFGDPKPDPRTQILQLRDGLTQLTDMCGRPVMASPTPAASSSG